MDLSYILNDLGEDREAYFNAVTPPIIQSTNFAFRSVSQMRKDLENEADAYFYTRGNNPTVEILRKKMAALEGTEDALIFASGGAAVTAAVMGNLNAGDHLVCVQKPYGWTAKLLQKLLPRFGVTATFVDGTDAASYEKAIQPNTKLLYLESPNSLTFSLQDVEAVTAIARKHGLLTVMDNSYCTPLNQQPVAMGVDLVVHSATKYLCGHSDALAGVVCGTRDMMAKLFDAEFMTLGGVISPFNAWLILRGLRTLHLRMERSAQSTPKVVEFLQNHPRVAKVYYPFLPSHPQYALAQKQMKRPGGMFSVELKADAVPEVERFCDSLKRFVLATSWGGYESLVYPMAVLAGASNYANPELNWRLVRFYVGLEEPDVLIADLEQALGES
jgi:cystathionine beta-lyase